MLQRSAAGAGALGALAIAGCDDGGSGSSTPLPQQGGVLRFGTSLPIAYGLDPHVEQGAGLAIFPKVYGYLLHVDPRDDAIVLDHAEGHEQPDATTLIVRLQPNVRFHDAASIGGARIVTASDVVASIERFRANPLVVDKTWHATVLTPDWTGTIDAELEVIGTERTGRVTALAGGVATWGPEVTYLPDAGLWPEVAGAIGGAIREEDRHFLDRVRTGAASPVASAADALEGLRVAEAIVRSAAEGREVRLG
jgi:ABC-type transport system substrate-binding protein